MDILETIIAHKRAELATAYSHPHAPRTTERTAPLRSMRHALESSPSGIIAEFKRRSPSRGWIHPKADPLHVVPAYQRGGAAACSILTDSQFFGGSLDDLRRVRAAVTLPLLRKEFIIDPLQIDEAYNAGADAVLLIASVLAPDLCHRLSAHAHSLGLEVLLEIHTAEELDRLDPSIELLGVNNRNLGTFDTDPCHSMQLLEALSTVTHTARSPLLISESGLSDAATLLSLREAGFRGFLMGEALMRHDHPGEALEKLIATLSASHTLKPNL